MVTISVTNIDKIINKYQKLSESYNGFTQKVAEKVAEKIREFILDQYKSNMTVWQEKNGNLETIDGSDVKVVKSGTSYFVTIGENTKKFEMPKRTEKAGAQYQGLPKEVNPYFFIEFGFGIIGQNSPIKFANDFGWRYNLKPYKNGWHFKGLDGTKTFSQGGKGIGAINSTNINFEKFVNSAINEVLNSGYFDK